MLSKDNKRNGIQWIPWDQLDDLDFADDLELFFTYLDQIAGGNATVAGASTQVGLRIN